MRICVDTADYQGTQELFVVNSVKLLLTALIIKCRALLWPFQLFIQNNTVVWSVGKSQKVRTVKKCYTAKSPVLDCLWCTFHLPSGNSSGDHDTVITGRYYEINIYTAGLPSQDFIGHFLLTVFFRVMHGKLSKRGATHSLKLRNSSRVNSK